MDKNFYKYKAQGVVKYHRHHDDGDGGWAVIDCPLDIVHYYNRVVRWLKWIKLSEPLHGAHITLVAGTHETGDKKKWGYRDGEKVDFWYGPVQGDGGYYWLPVYCPDIQEIRKVLGLKPNLKWQAHLTIGYENP